MEPPRRGTAPLYSIDLKTAVYKSQMLGKIDFILLKKTMNW
jgi:hypothetical protein